MPNPFRELERLEARGAADDPALVVRLAGVHNNCAICYANADDQERALFHFGEAASVLSQGLARFPLGKDAHEAYQMHAWQYAEHLARAGEPALALAAYEEALGHLAADGTDTEVDTPLTRGILESGRSFALEALGRHEEALTARINAMALFALTEGNEYVPDFPEIATNHMAKYAAESLRLIGE
jgi:tetratricopeptide (TPR) repeat protein